MTARRARLRGRIPARTLRAPVLATLGLAALLMLSCGPRPAGSDGPPDAAIDPLGPNAACYVCHMTFVREKLSKTHLAAKVGCINCHGLSAAHANDEDVGATKPDIVLKRPQIDPACRKCHPTHDVAPGKVVARFHKRFATRAPPPPIACTDCHGSHKIARKRGRSAFPRSPLPESTRTSATENAPATSSPQDQRR